MIREEDLREAIAECNGERNPNASTCLKLAAYYTILNNMKGTDPEPVKAEALPPAYSFAPPEYTSDTEFGRLISEKDTYTVLEIMDELMETLRIMYPRLYDAVLRKLTAE